MELAFRVGRNKTIANWNVQISPALTQLDSEYLELRTENSALEMEPAFGDRFEFGMNTPALTQLDSEF
jgi:hypothetical protein